MLRVIVEEPAGGNRLDVVVATASGLSRARAGELVGRGGVRVDGRVERKSYRVAPGEVIEIEQPPAPEVTPPGGVGVVVQDEHLLVVDKPAGVVTHRAPGLAEGTLVDALEADGHDLAALPGPDRPGIVHRLDRDVSGLLVVAKTDAAHAALSEAMRRREITRRYVALVQGSPETDRGKIDAPIGRDPRTPTRMTVLAHGRPSTTLFAVRDRLVRVSLVDVQLQTGRTHQIRVHLSSIGHPVAGDAAYGADARLSRELGLARPFLHAAELAFTHPVTGAPVEARSPLPPELSAALDAAGGAAR